jgi:hypothetical protein
MPGNANTATGYQGTQNIVTPGVPGTVCTKAGTVQAVMAANFETPDVYTVMFNLTASQVLPVPTPSQGPPDPTIVQPSGSASGVRCVAILNFKVEGIQVQRVIDIGSGTSISATCQSIDVAVQDLTWTIQGQSALQYSISVSVTRGVRPATSLPPTLWSATSTTPPNSGIFTIGPGASAVIDVPENSGVTSVEVVGVDLTTLATGGSEQLFFTVDHEVGSVFNKFYVPTLEPGFVKVNPGTQKIRLTNHSTTDTITATVTWGIDG